MQVRGEGVAPAVVAAGVAYGAVRIRVRFESGMGGRSTTKAGRHSITITTALLTT